MGPLRFRASSPPWRHSPGLLSTVEALASGIRERGYFRVDRGKLVVVDSFGGWSYGKTCMNEISKITLKTEENIQNRSEMGSSAAWGRHAGTGPSSPTALTYVGDLRVGAKIAREAECEWIARIRKRTRKRTGLRTRKRTLNGSTTPGGFPPLGAAMDGCRR